MRIKIVDGNILTDAIAILAVSDFIESICSHLDFSSDNIDEVVFADEVNYGKEIKRIDPEEDYTNNSIGRGYGKALFLSQKKKSSLVINSQIFKCIVLMNNNLIDAFETQFIKFIISHEIGHCIINQERGASIKSVPILFYNPNEIAQNCFSIIIDEFLTNRIIKNIVNCKCLYDNLQSGFYETLLKLRNGLITFVDSYFYTKIWELFKYFMDNAVLLLDYDVSEYCYDLDRLQLPFDYVAVINEFKKFDAKLIAEEELLMFLNNIVSCLHKKYYVKNTTYHII